MKRLIIIHLIIKLYKVYIITVSDSLKKKRQKKQAIQWAIHKIMNINLNNYMITTTSAGN